YSSQSFYGRYPAQQQSTFRFLSCVRLRAHFVLQPPFQLAAPRGQRVAHREVDARDQEIDQEGLEDRVVDQLPRANQLDEAHDGSQRRVLDDLHHEAHRGRRCDAHRLRQNDQPQALGPRQRQAFGGFPLSPGHGLDAAAPYLAKVGADVDDHRYAGRHQAGQGKPRDAQPEIGHEKQHQQRRALNDLYVYIGQPTDGGDRADAAQGHHTPRHAAADESDQ